MMSARPQLRPRSHGTGRIRDRAQIRPILKFDV